MHEYAGEVRECRSGLGLVGGECRPCKVDGCQKCDGERPSRPAMGVAMQPAVRHRGRSHVDSSAELIMMFSNSALQVTCGPARTASSRGATLRTGSFQTQPQAPGAHRKLWFRVVLPQDWQQPRA